jgi:hypothetical protein
MLGILRRNSLQYRPRVQVHSKVAITHFFWAVQAESVSCLVLRTVDSMDDGKSDVLQQFCAITGDSASPT